MGQINLWKPRCHRGWVSRGRGAQSCVEFCNIHWKLPVGCGERNVNISILTDFWLAWECLLLPNEVQLLWEMENVRSTGSRHFTWTPPLLPPPEQPPGRLFSLFSGVCSLWSGLGCADSTPLPHSGRLWAPSAAAYCQYQPLQWGWLMTSGTGIAKFCL